MESGEQILLRHLFFGRVFFAVPLRVVADDGEAIVTWCAPGTRCIYPDIKDERGAYRPVETWRTREISWWGNGVLRIAPRGRAHALMHFWEDDGSFAGWYVNLEDPLRETARGYDSTDHGLDVWIEPDGSWRWKDEDDLTLIGSAGNADPAAVRAEGERVLADWPFPTGWEDWRPDAAWPLPELPADWHVV